MTPAEAANNWGPAALIVFGYMVAAFWQNKRVEDLKDWIKAEFKAVDSRLDTIAEKLDTLNLRVKALEDARSSSVVGVR